MASRSACRASSMRVGAVGSNPTSAIEAEPSKTSMASRGHPCARAVWAVSETQIRVARAVFMLSSDIASGLKSILAVTGNQPPRKHADVRQAPQRYPEHDRPRHGRRFRESADPAGARRAWLFLSRYGGQGRQHAAPALQEPYRGELLYRGHGRGGECADRCDLAADARQPV